MRNHWIVEDNITTALNYRNKAVKNPQDINLSDRSIRKEISRLMKTEKIDAITASELVKRAYRNEYIKSTKEAQE